MFDGRYDEAPAHDRPVYGVWNRHDDVYGASPRFGSAYLRLRPEVTRRTTFCWPDSVYLPQVVGGPEKLEQLCRMADASDVDPSVVSSAPADLPLDDPLNDYVEAHVHGGLLVARDVEAPWWSTQPIVRSTPRRSSGWGATWRSTPVPA